MAGDPYYEATTIGWEDTTWSTTQTAEPTTTTGYDVYITYVDRTDEFLEKIKELLRKQVVLEMKNNWIKKPRPMKPMPLMRPTHQLKNICFNGRGWT